MAGGIYYLIIERRRREDEGKNVPLLCFRKGEEVAPVGRIFSANAPDSGAGRKSTAVIVISGGAPKAYAGSAGDIFDAAVNKRDDAALAFIEKHTEIVPVDADAGIIRHEASFFRRSGGRNAGG